MHFFCLSLCRYYYNSQHMRVKVNRRYVEVFEGAKVKHALLRYFVVKDLDREKIASVEVFDAWGHLIDHDAPLTENQKIKFKEKRI